jgi:hypothetical protein
MNLLSLTLNKRCNGLRHSGVVLKSRHVTCLHIRLGSELDKPVLTFSSFFELDIARSHLQPVSIISTLIVMTEQQVI